MCVAMVVSIGAPIGDQLLRLMSASPRVSAISSSASSSCLTLRGRRCAWALRCRQFVGCACAKASPIMPLSDLYEFICEGPLLAKIGMNAEIVKEDMEEWLELGLRLSRILGFRDLFLTESEKARVYHYYLPVYMWCKNQLQQHRSQFKDGESIPAIVIGISAPQGCGKTTLVDALEYLFNSTGRRAASVSIDDFYLTAAEQAQLAEENKGNSLLELRGNAGSHDLQLGAQTLNSLRNLAEGVKVKVPHYNKSANKGRGDRADSSTWSLVEGPLQVVLFEGWMLGFQPLLSSLVHTIDPQLEVVNKNLEEYEEAWFKFIDSWIIVQVEDYNWVYKWRLEAEHEMKASGKPGMSDQEVADFVARYMPAYKAYLEPLYTKGPNKAHPSHLLNIRIDANRNPIG